MPHTGQTPLSVGVTDVEQVKTERNILLAGFSLNETIRKQKGQKGDHTQEKLYLEQKKKNPQTNKSTKKPRMKVVRHSVGSKEQSKRNHYLRP